jgi:hypothetical protein
MYYSLSIPRVYRFTNANTWHLELLLVDLKELLIDQLTISERDH